MQIQSIDANGECSGDSNNIQSIVGGRDGSGGELNPKLKQKVLVAQAGLQLGDAETRVKSSMTGEMGSSAPSRRNVVTRLTGLPDELWSLGAASRCLVEHVDPAIS